MPCPALAALSKLLNRDGALVVIDYEPHENEALRAEQADLWLGFEPDELRALSQRAGLGDVVINTIPAQRCGKGPDADVRWQCMVARRNGDERTRAGTAGRTRREER